MRFTSILGLTALTASALVFADAGVPNHSENDPCVTITNKRSQRDIFVVTTTGESAGGSYHGDPVTVEGNSELKFWPGSGFNGALTGSNGQGTRHEMNFNDPTTTWYDSDMEMGMDDSTFGPANHQPESDGDDSLAGERDTLATANKAWGSLDGGTKQSLLNSGYVKGNQNTITSLRMNKQAPQALIDFLQQTAHFNAYITHGSVNGIAASKSDATADKQTRTVTTNKMEIIAY